MTTLPSVYIDKINENLNRSNDIISFFGETWLNNEIYSEQEYHPLIVILSDLNLIRKLEDDLRVLRRSCIKYPTIIRKLKSDKANFFPNLSEVEITAYYYRKYNSECLDYEPSVEGGKKLDLMLKGKNNEYYFEIFTVMEDQILTNYREIMEEIRLKTIKLNLPYAISFRINENFKSSYVDDFVNFIRDSLNNNEGDLKYFKNNIGVAEFRYESSSISDVIGSHGPGVFTNPHGRLIDRIRRKISEQIPANQNNILVINLAYVLNIFLITDLALDSIKFPENVTMIIAYVNNDYKHQKKCYLNPNLDKNFLKEVIQDIK